MDTSHLFIISGPSGVGEDSVIEGLSHKLSTERVVTTTTRKPREGEWQGDPYYFVSRDAFEAKIAAGEMVEYAQEYNDNYYGVSKEEIERVASCGKIGIWKIEYKGVMTAKQLFPGIIAIFLTVSDLSVLEARIRRRYDKVSDDYIRERMEYTKEWLKHTDIYDYTVYNEEGKLDEAVSAIQEIIERHTNSAQTTS